MSERSHQERTASGRCYSCGQCPAVPGRTRCAGCADREAERARAARRDFAARGLCPTCRRPGYRPTRRPTRAAG